MVLPHVYSRYRFGLAQFDSTRKPTSRCCGSFVSLPCCPCDVLLTRLLKVSMDRPRNCSTIIVGLTVQTGRRLQFLATSTLTSRGLQLARIMKLGEQKSSWGKYKSERLSIGGSS